jgi:hypothetical protein
MLLLFVCAATAAQSAQADDQPSLAAIHAACADKESLSDQWCDLIRGVDTLSNPNGGTTQLCNLGQYHFTDGFGNYRHR